MRISDWSSDVCSSDLIVRRAIVKAAGKGLADRGILQQLGVIRTASALGDRHDMGLRIEQIDAVQIAHLADLALGHMPGVARTRRSVGKECVSTCKSRWSRYHSKHKHKITKKTN